MNHDLQDLVLPFYILKKVNSGTGLIHGIDGTRKARLCESSFTYLQLRSPQPCINTAHWRYKLEPEYHKLNMFKRRDTFVVKSNEKKYLR